MIPFDGVSVFLAVIVCITGILFFLFVLQPLGLPFVPSRNATVSELFSLLGDIKGKKILDLGSGDGKIVIAAAKRGAYSVGFEINPLLVWFSRVKITHAGLASVASIQQKDFWSTDIGEYDIIIFYGVVTLTSRLEQKLQQELKSRARVLTLYCALPHWKPCLKKGNIFIYELPEE